jgi:outer membrane murein-binding lipoprotein Lpp
MICTSRLLARGAWLSVALLVGVGCKQGPTPEVQARIDSLTQAASERDRLMQEVAENTRLVSEVSREISKVNVPAKQLKISSESPLRASRDTLIQKIRYVTSRVRDLEPRLKESEQHVKQLATISDSLRNELASTLQNLQGVIENQKETIDALNQQVETLTAQNTALRDTLENMSTIANTVYYVIGTKDDLERKGIIQEVGGARFLFVLWKSGKTLVPARNLDPTEFTQVDRRHFTQLPLPAEDKEYRIVSRQDTSALDTPPDHDGRLTAHIVKISDTGKFWAASKYLIIVEG